MAQKKGISAEELRVHTQIDTLIGRIHRDENLLDKIQEFDEPFRDLIYTIDRALRRARQRSEGQ